MPKTADDLTTEEWEAIALSEEGQRIANIHHQGSYGTGTEHCIYHSCPCYHIAVGQLLASAQPAVARPIRVEWWRCGKAGEGRGWTRCDSPINCDILGCKRVGRDSQ